MRGIGIAILLTVGGTATAAERGLDIYYVDTEGGAATLLVTPAGESVLIDCGNPGPRDADRIHKTAKTAGLEAIDHLAITHWHLDHYGGVDRLRQLLPIRAFWDRGIPDKLSDDPKNFPVLIENYRTASRGMSKTLKAGDVLPLRQAAGAAQIKLDVLCSSGAVIPDAPGAPKNPLADEHKAKEDDPSDNARSVGFRLSFGDFRFLDLGDLTWNIEYKLVAPSDKIGPVDVYQVTHHGLDSSNNPVLIRTVKPTIAVFNNGPRKGGHPSVTATLRRVAEVQAIYQMHKNVTVAEQENTRPDLIANPEKTAGEGIKISVSPDGKTYTVTVGSKGTPRKFETRKKS